MSRLPEPRAWLGVAAASVLTVLAFPPYALWPLAFVGHAPLAAALEGRRPGQAFLLGWAWAAAMGLGVAHWLVVPLVDEYGVGALPAWSFCIGLVVAYAALHGAGLALYARWRPGVSAAAAPLLYAASYAAVEWLRAIPLGLPWVLFGEALAPAPLWLQTAELGGAWAVGFVPVAVGAGLGLAALRRRPAPLALPAAAALVALGFGALRLAAPAPEGPRMRVGVIQASVPQRERFRPGSAARNTRLHVERSEALLARAPVDLLVWSETAVDEFLEHTPARVAEVQALVDRSGVPLLTGAPRDHGGGRLANSAVVFAPGHPLAESYDKQMLVPFAEVDPRWGGWLRPLLARVAQGTPYTPGPGPVVFHVPPVPVATPICFEITDPHLVRRMRAAGARMLINLSNDAWFGRSAYAQMHFDQAVLRAVELRMPVVRGANTGISGVIDARGRVVRRLGLFVQGGLVAGVTGATRTTLYGRLGDAPALGLLLAGIAGAAWRGEAASRRG